MIYSPKNRQSILDVILQHQGSLDNLYSVMNENGFKTIIPTMSNGVIITPNEKNRVVQFFLKDQITPSNLPDLPDYDFDPEDFDINNGDFI
jgi:hypothetical protein